MANNDKKAQEANDLKKKEFKAYVKNGCKTRLNSEFKIEAFQHGLDGLTTAARGKVFIEDKVNNKIEEIDMLWNLDGGALLHGQHLDLIREEKFEEETPATPATV